MDRGEMWLLIRREIGKRYPDASDHEIIRNDANASTIADAILAIGTPDATGDLIRKTVMHDGYDVHFSKSDDGTEILCEISGNGPDSGEEYFAISSAPFNALDKSRSPLRIGERLQAALATAEEAER